MRSRLHKISKDYLGDFNSINENTNVDPDYSFGEWVGEEISKILPVLETDSLHTNCVVKISEEEFLEYKKLEDVWSDKIFNNKGIGKNETWDELMKYRKLLKEKYLEKKVSYSISGKIKIKDVNLFLKGVSESIWDSDISNYKCKPEEIDFKINDDNYSISLYLD